ncbi:hypothetical protein MRX96_047102 [Rhipicephalus microplus]
MAQLTSVLGRWPKRHSPGERRGVVAETGKKRGRSTDDYNKGWPSAQLPEKRKTPERMKDTSRERVRRAVKEEARAPRVRRQQRATVLYAIALGHIKRLLYHSEKAKRRYGARKTPRWRGQGGNGAVRLILLASAAWQLMPPNGCQRKSSICSPRTAVSL